MSSALAWISSLILLYLLSFRIKELGMINTIKPPILSKSKPLVMKYWSKVKASVIVFSLGDSTKISTWSNVPYFFTTTLEKQGIKVNRVNLQESKYLKLLYFFWFGWMIKFFFKKSAYTYYRSTLNNWDTKRKIKKAVQVLQMLICTYS
mgnify:CR=1 FL=1